MARCFVKSAEECLDKEFPVLDGGFVRLVDYMGDDGRIVQAARVSCGESTKTFRRDAALIDYLMCNGHTSPFEQVVFTFHAKMPIFVARQWIRHRTARVNEISGRYSVLKDEFHVPQLNDIAEQSSVNRQGRKSEAMDRDRAEKVQALFERSQRESFQVYQEILGEDTSRELARMVLPLGTFTQWYWQIDLHNLFRFLKLRLHSHAQREIRVYAEVIRELATRVCPVAFASFERHVLSGVSFSGEEARELRRRLNGGKGG